MTEILILLVIILVLSAIFYGINRNHDSTSTYSFQSQEKVALPYITISVNGHFLNMIVDSGASVSVIQKNTLKDISYGTSSRSVALSAVTEDSIDSDVVVIPININGKEVITDFVVYEGEDIAGLQSKGIKVDGILGVEFFKATNGKINFQNQTVEFP